MHRNHAAASIVAAGLVLALTMSRADGQGAAGQDGSRPAEQAYKNIQVMKGVPASQFMAAMHDMTTSLGQECGFCHVEDLSSDAKPMKQVARRMIAMTQAINAQSFGGRTMVGCDTCHRGATLPITVPAVQPPLRIGNYTWPIDTGSPVLPLPTPDAILAKYEQALGGREALSKVTTRVHLMQRQVYFGAVGVGVMPLEPSGVSDVVRYARMPDRIIANHQKTDGSFMQWLGGCDGKSCWNGEASGAGIPVGADRPITESTYERQARSFHNNYFYGYMPLDLARLKAHHSKLEVRSRQKIMLTIGPGKDEVHDTYLVVGYVKDSDVPEYMYFDVDSGLLVRRSNGTPTIYGPNYQQIDFSDYRVVGSGTKVPFLHINQHYDEKSREIVTLVQDNVPIDDSIFAKPRTVRSPARQGQ
jgi:hypothetical protein